MTDRVHGSAVAGESLTGDLDFFTVDTLLNIQGTGVFGDGPTDLFEVLVEAIAQKAQPVLVSAVTTFTAAATEPGFDPATSGGETVYSFKFAVEHSDVWTEAGATDAKAEALLTVFDGLAVFDAAGVAQPGAGDIFDGVGVGRNIRVTFAETL